MQKKIASVLSIMLGKTVSPADDITMQTEPLWDSIKHIEIIMTLEQELDISFKPEDIPTLTSQALIVKKASELLA